MSVGTKIQCYSYRGGAKSLESSSFVGFNPAALPGCAVLAGSCAAEESIGSQVACRLALEHFSESIIQTFSQSSYPRVPADFGLHALEQGFRDANRNVYTFGHSLAAGGRLSAVFMALLCIRDENGNSSFCVGRVGQGSAYLYREGELFPFFEQSGSHSDGGASFLGANSVVSVDLANVPIEAGDTVFLFSEPLDVMEEHELRALVEEILPGTSRNPAEEISKFLFEDPGSVGFAFSVHIGPTAFFLKREFEIRAA